MPISLSLVRRGMLQWDLRCPAEIAKFISDFSKSLEFCSLSLLPLTLPLHCCLACFLHSFSPFLSDHFPHPLFYLFTTSLFSSLFSLSVCLSLPLYLSLSLFLPPYLPFSSFFHVCATSFHTTFFHLFAPGISPLFFLSLSSHPPFSLPFYLCFSSHLQLLSSLFILFLLP